MFLDLSHDLLRSGYAIRFRTPGHSMHPTIRDGETVTVEPTTALDVRRGDIVLYRTGNRAIAHRVVDVNAKRFILRGDASREPDEPVEASQILGKVIMVEREGRARKLRGDKLKRALYRFAVRVKQRR